MMTIRRLSIGAGYKYLLKSIAISDGPEGTDRSDLVRYYSETGPPPGVFLGAGLVGLNNGLGVAVGQSVTAENLQRMLQDCADPITGEVLGRVPGAKAVGGFDLTFSPAKSVSVAWALAVSDSAWRPLDSRGLFASTVMLSEMHQGVLSDLLTVELGWDWEAHTRRSSSAPKWE